MGFHKKRFLPVSFLAVVLLLWPGKTASTAVTPDTMFLGCLKQIEVPVSQAKVLYLPVDLSATDQELKAFHSSGPGLVVIATPDPPLNPPDLARQLSRAAHQRPPADVSLTILAKGPVILDVGNKVVVKRLIHCGDRFHLDLVIERSSVIAPSNVPLVPLVEVPLGKVPGGQSRVDVTWRVMPMDAKVRPVPSTSRSCRFQVGGP